MRVKTYKKVAGWRRWSLRSINYNQTSQTLLTIILAFLIVAFLNSLVVQPYKVSGSSMEPTLAHNERLLVWKGGRSWADFRGQDYQPDRGDIVVFKKPSEPSTRLIKRVVGLPGERVVINDGQITVYQAGQIQGQVLSGDWDLLPAFQPGEHYNITVGSNEVMVLGDNRSPGASQDSRSSLGNISIDNIIGELVFRLTPIYKVGVF